jgi:hypothetical protein
MFGKMTRDLRSGLTFKLIQRDAPKGPGRETLGAIGW